jgi:hypothetical protein
MDHWRGLTVFVSVEVAGHDTMTLADFTAKVAAMREVREFIASRGTPIMACVLPFPIWRRSTLFTIAWPRRRRSKV